MFFRELYIIFKQDNFFTEFLFTLGSCNHVAGMLFSIEAAVLLAKDFYELFNKYESYRNDVRNGRIGRTAQFWSLYLDLTRYQTMAHTAVQENDTKSLMFCWRQYLPLYFALNKLHYAR